MISSLMCTSFLTLLLFLPSALGAISRACNDSHQLLAKNTALVEATPEGRLCQVEVKPGESGSCTVDLRKDSATFKSLCLQAGAQFREFNFAYECRVSDSFTTYDVDFYFKNNPACLSQNCTIEEIQEEIESNVFPAAEQQLAEKGFQCDLSSMVVAESAGVAALHGPRFVSMLALTTSAWAIIEAAW
jgi:hypothetical protein